MPTSTLCSVIEARCVSWPRRLLLELPSEGEQCCFATGWRCDLHGQGHTGRVHAHRYDDGRIAGQVPRVLERCEPCVGVDVAEPTALTPAHGRQWWSRQARCHD